MWNLKSKAMLSASVLLALVSTLNGCSLAGRGGDSSLYVDLSSLKAHDSPLALMDLSNPSVGLGPPSTASGFSCYAVDVTGPGIADSSPNPDPNVDVTFNNLLNVPGTSCSYRGVLSPPIFLDSTGNAGAALQIPPGGVRLVQVVGVNDPVVCQSGVIGNESTPNNGSSRYFEVGRAVLNNVFSDVSVNIATTWPTSPTAQAARSMDCGNGGCTNVSDVPQASPTGLPITSSVQKYAFKIPTVPGKYIRTVSLLLNPILNILPGTVNATVQIYSGTSGGTMNSGMAQTGFSTSMNLAGAAAPGVAALVSFDMFSASNQYLQMVATNDYWIVLSSSDATTGTFGKTLSLVGNAGTAVTPVQTAFSVSWTAVTGVADVVNQVLGCP